MECGPSRPHDQLPVYPYKQLTIIGMLLFMPKSLVTTCIQWCGDETMTFVQQGKAEHRVSKASSLSLTFNSH